MVANRKEFKSVMGRIGAVLMVGTIMVFTFAGCGKKEPEQATVKSDAIEFVDEKRDSAYARGLMDFSTAKEVENTESEGFNIDTAEQEVVEYTIDFADAANEDITVKEGSEVEIPEFEAEEFFNVMKTNLAGTFELRDEGAYYDGALVSEDYETTEDNKVIVKNVIYAEESHYQVHYVVENNKIVAKDIVKNTGESGINYVLDLDNLTLVGIQDVKGTDIAKLKINLGKCIGWNEKKGSAEVTIHFKDKLDAIADSVLYPVYESRMIDTDSEGHKIDFDGNIVEIAIKDGKPVYVGKDNKEVNDNGEVVEKKAEEPAKKDNKEEQKGKDKGNSGKQADNKPTTQPTETAPATNPAPQAPKENPAPIDNTPSIPTTTGNDMSAWGSETVDWGSVDWDTPNIWGLGVE